MASRPSGPASTPRWLSARDVEDSLDPRAAVEALRRALLDGLDPGADPARSVLDLAHGQLLLMPSGDGGRAGVKIVSVAPGNPAEGLPLVQAVYVLFDAGTLTPLAVLDGTALTSLRTPAVSALAAGLLAPPTAARLVVFGAGPQAREHIRALGSVFGLSEVVVVSRGTGRAAELVDHVAATGLAARTGDPGAVAGADLVVCATTAGEPLFPASLVPSTACVIAVGSHEPTRTELDPALLRHAGTVVVEDRRTALREAGAVVRAVAAGVLRAEDLIPLADLVTGRARPCAAGPWVFTSVGMAWEDLVVASAIHRAAAGLTEAAPGPPRRADPRTPDAG